MAVDEAVGCTRVNVEVENGVGNGVGVMALLQAVINRTPQAMAIK
jgi:hypothetical protein